MKTIQLFCRRFEPEDILSLVSPEMLASIKAHDPNPVLVAYVVAGTGLWHPVGLYDDQGPDVGEISLDAAQVTQVAEQIAAKVKMPHTESMRLFKGHTHATSDLEFQNMPERPALAYVVGVGEMSVNGIPSAVVASYFPPESAQYARSFPAVSLEMRTLGRQVVDWARKVVRIAVERISDVTGIALLKDEKPAYSGALRMGIIYAQESQERLPMDLSQIPFDALAGEVKRRKLYLWQVFDPSDVVGERHVVDGKVKWVGGDRKLSEMIDSMIEAETERISSAHAEALKAAQAEISRLKPLEGEVQRARAVPELVKAAKALNDPLFASRIERRAARFSPGEDLAKSIADFIAAEKAEYDEDRKELSRAAGSSGADLGGSDTAGSGKPKADEWLGVDDVPAEFLKRG